MKPEAKKAKPPESKTAGDTVQIKRLLAPLLKEIGAKWVLLVDVDGRPIAHHGERGRFDLKTIAPVIAASFATMSHIARHFGGEFSVMLHHGMRNNVQLSLVGEKLILAMIFGNHAPVGAARLCAQQVTRKLESVIPRTAGLKAEFVDAVKTRLDDLLGP